MADRFGDLDLRHPSGDGDTEVAGEFGGRGLRGRARWDGRMRGHAWMGLPGWRRGAAGVGEVAGAPDVQQRGWPCPRRRARWQSTPVGRCCVADVPRPGIVGVGMDCPQAATAASPGCAAARSPHSPTSASSTTPRWKRGHLAGVSPAVLEAVAHALRLDDAERAHLLNLAHTATGADTLTRPRRRAGRIRTPSPSLQWTLDATTTGPAFVRNGHMDLLAANQRGRSFYTDVYASDGASPFSTPGDAVADATVTILRIEAGRDPHDKDLHDLVGELPLRSDRFRTRRGAHNVRCHGTGEKRFHHPVIGRVILAYQSLEVTAEPGQTSASTPPNPAHPPTKPCASSPPGPPPKAPTHTHTARAPRPGPP